MFKENRSPTTGPIHLGLTNVGCCAPLEGDKEIKFKKKICGGVWFHFPLIWISLWTKQECALHYLLYGILSAIKASE